MHNVDTLVKLIHEGRNGEALEMLNASPALATAHSDEDGQLHGVRHCIGHRIVTLSLSANN